MPVRVHKSRSWLAESMQNWWIMFFWKNKINSDSYVGWFLTSFSGEIKCLVTSNRTLPGPHNRCLSDCTKGGIWWTADNLWIVVFFISRCESLWLLFVVTEYSLYVASLQCKRAKRLYSNITSRQYLYCVSRNIFRSCQACLETDQPSTPSCKLRQGELKSRNRLQIHGRCSLLM